MATTIDPTWVLDTSVAAAWFLTRDDHREVALEVRLDVRTNPRTYAVPTLFYSEFVHVLTMRSARDVDFVRSSLDQLIRFGIRTFPLARTALMKTPHWSCQGLGGYDATFVALAEDIGGTWLTADDRGARLAGELAVTLDEWSRA